MKKVLYFFLAIFVIFVLFLGFAFFRYSSWEKDFVMNENIICTSDEEVVSVLSDMNILEKIKNFVLSDIFSEFVTFTKKEMLFLLKDSLSAVSGGNIQDICLESGSGVWKIYIHSKIEFLQLPWLAFDIHKDSRETAELYSRNLYVGDFKVPEIFSKGVLEKINKGISDALLLVVENGFLGKTIKNIDLLKDSVVLKGGF